MYASAKTRSSFALAAFLLATAFGGSSAQAEPADACNLNQTKQSVDPRIRFGALMKVIDEADAKESGQKYTWQKFRSKPQPGDCVIAFDTTHDPNAPLNGAATGYLLIRRGFVIDEFITSIR
jgi:hypothetical protein